MCIQKGITSKYEFSRSRLDIVPLVVITRRPPYTGPFSRHRFHANEALLTRAVIGEGLVVYFSVGTTAPWPRPHRTASSQSTSSAWDDHNGVIYRSQPSGFGGQTSNSSNYIVPRLYFFPVSSTPSVHVEQHSLIYLVPNYRHHEIDINKQTKFKKQIELIVDKCYRLWRSSWTD